MPISPTVGTNLAACKHLSHHPKPSKSEYSLSVQTSSRQEAMQALGNENSFPTGDVVYPNEAEEGELEGERW